MSETTQEPPRTTPLHELTWLIAGLTSRHFGYEESERLAQRLLDKGVTVALAPPAVPAPEDTPPPTTTGGEVGDEELVDELEHRHTLYLTCGKPNRSAERDDLSGARSALLARLTSLRADRDAHAILWRDAEKEIVALRAAVARAEQENERLKHVAMKAAGAAEQVPSLRKQLARAEQEREQDRKDLGDHHDWPTTILVCQANAHAVQMNHEEIERLRSRVAAILAENELLTHAVELLYSGDGYMPGCALCGKLRELGHAQSITLPAPGGADHNQEGEG